MSLNESAGFPGAVAAMIDRDRSPLPKLGPVQDMGDRWGERVEFYSMNRDCYVQKIKFAKKSKTKNLRRCSEKVYRSPSSPLPSVLNRYSENRGALSNGRRTAME
jgi:hypothetical protein